MIEKKKKIISKMKTKKWQHTENHHFSFKLHGHQILIEQIQ